MNLSKSRYCNAVQCKKMLWLYANKPDEASELSNDSVLENGNMVHEVARDLLGEHVTIEYNSNLNEMIKETNSHLKKDNIIIAEASFNYNNNFCSVDLLKKTNDEYEIYEVKSSTKLHDVYITDISYQLYVLTKLGYNVTKCNIVILNNKYVKNGDLELDKLFTVIDVASDALDRFNDVEDNIEDISKYMLQKDEPNDDIDIKCFKPYDCPFFSYCTKSLPKLNIFNIRDMRNTTKIKLYKNGKYDYESLLNEDIDEKYKQQIEYELYDKEDYINEEKIDKFLNTLTYPLYFLDFETFSTPIPKYDGTSPNNQIPFQYSLHYLESEGSVLKHIEFLAETGIDPRRSLAESLVESIPLNVCTLAYKMSFEKTVIKNLANTYPDLREHLMNIHDNIKDLMIPFKDRNYYTKDMHGSYSIKYVLPALFPDDESLNYHNLDLIHNGSEAMNSYADLEKKSKEEQEYIRERLLRYCELDTYAMVKIYQKLKK